MAQNEKQDTHDWNTVLFTQMQKRVSEISESWKNHTAQMVPEPPVSLYQRFYETLPDQQNPSPGKGKNYERLAAADMTSQSYRHYKAMAQAAGLTGELKVYKDTDNKNDTAPSAKVAYTATHDPVVIINDSEHQYTAAYARKLATSDASLQHAVDTKALFKVTRENAPAIYDRYAKLAMDKERMDLPYVPDLYLSFNFGISNFTDMARRTQEGRMYTILEPSDIQRSGDKGTDAILAHETTHHADGHTTFEQVALIHNDRTFQLSKAAEHQADVDSVGARGTCQPQALADFFIESRDLMKQNYPGKSARELGEIIAKADPYHPSLDQRIAYLSQLSAHPPAGCKEHELQLPLTTPVPPAAASTLNLPPR